MPQEQHAGSRPSGGLTNPSGTLGALEDLAGLQGTERPAIERVAITVFVADHGVVAEGVSAYPQAVTREMLRNYLSGGAAISVLARAIGAYGRVLGALGVQPLLDLGMRLGEGSGAALAVPILRLACALPGGMATFDEAAVSGPAP